MRTTPYVTMNEAEALMLGPEGRTYIKAQFAGLGRLKAKWDAAMLAGYITADRTKKSNDRLSGLWFWWCDLNKFPWVVVYTYSWSRRVEVQMDLVGQDYRLSDQQCADLHRAIVEIGGRPSPHEIRVNLAGHTFSQAACDFDDASRVAEAMLAAALEARREQTGIETSIGWVLAL